MTEFILTKEELSRIIKNRESDYWHDAMAKVLPAAGINTHRRVAGFIAQCAVESRDFNTLEENLNYSESALNRVFGRYFRNRDAGDYARNPKKIANYVYMDEYRTKRGALGNVVEGDGWKFRGRGLKQLTGRSNYARFGKSIGMTADQAVEYVATKEGALASAVWYWNNANCNYYADRGDIVGLSKAINGGTNGLNDRIRVWKKALSVIDPNDTSLVDDNGSTQEKKTTTKAKGKTNIYLNIRSRGKEVKTMQQALGISADGIFGPNTRRAVKRFQLQNGLQADGIAGPNTLTKLYS